MTRFHFGLVGLRPTPSGLTGALKDCVEKLVICLCVVLLCPVTALGQQSAKKPNFDVETDWPGIHFRLDRVERILDDRLLVVVRIVATAKAPAAGTLIGIKPTLPAEGTHDNRQPPTYELRPFSLASSVMVDDLTTQKFSALPPIFPLGREYAPSEILANFLPGRAEVLTLQFKVPPAALRPDSGSEKHTISLLLTNAKAPMMRVPVPSADKKVFTPSDQSGG